MLTLHDIYSVKQTDICVLKTQLANVFWMHHTFVDNDEAGTGNVYEMYINKLNNVVMELRASL